MACVQLVSLFKWIKFKLKALKCSFWPNTKRLFWTFTSYTTVQKQIFILFLTVLVTATIYTSCDLFCETKESIHHHSQHLLWASLPWLYISIFNFNFNPVKTLIVSLAQYNQVTWTLFQFVVQYLIPTAVLCVVVVLSTDLILTVFCVLFLRHGSVPTLTFRRSGIVSVLRWHKSRQNLDLMHDRLSNNCTALVLIRLTEIHKGGKQKDKAFICVSVYLVKLRRRVRFLIPEMTHRSLNMFFGTVLETKPDEREQFTKEHIL